MRKTIRLTGRKQLPQSHFMVTLDSSSDPPRIDLELAEDWNKPGFPDDAELRLKLVENKLVEVLTFGTVAKPRRTMRLSRNVFRAPSCQVRIVSRAAGHDGLLLGSTKAWTLRSAGDPEGILFFQAADISPRLWKLDIRTQEHPLLYIDDRVPNAAAWAKSDPVFVASVLPQVAATVLSAVLESTEAPEDTWEADWIRWSQALVPGTKPPFDGDPDDKAAWIDDVVDAFSREHEMTKSAIAFLESRR